MKNIYNKVMSDATTLIMMFAVCPSMLNTPGTKLFMASVTSFCFKRSCICWLFSRNHSCIACDMLLVSVLSWT